MLPFDDDDEIVMREKVILGEFEDPEWLSSGKRVIGTLTAADIESLFRM
jgi:hypothetical protein